MKRTSLRDRPRRLLGFVAPSGRAEDGTAAVSQDDYPQALSRARARKLPIFAEAWAPW